jgi:hypothetical protein
LSFSQSRDTKKAPRPSAPPGSFAAGAGAGAGALETAFAGAATETPVAERAREKAKRSGVAIFFQFKSSSPFGIGVLRAFYHIPCSPPFKQGPFYGCPEKILFSVPLARGRRAG